MFTWNYHVNYIVYSHVIISAIFFDNSKLWKFGTPSVGQNVVDLLWQSKTHPTSNLVINNFPCFTCFFSPIFLKKNDPFAFENLANAASPEKGGGGRRDHECLAAQHRSLYGAGGVGRCQWNPVEPAMELMFFQTHYYIYNYIIYNYIIHIKYINMWYVILWLILCMYIIVYSMLYI